MLETPVLYLIYNRLAPVKKSFETLRKAQPSRLFIGADGPRSPEDHLNCEKVRSWVLEHIDWPCEVHQKFEADNLGCGLGVSSAISWFFDHEEEGIILEDDIIPDDSFYHFCESLLAKYQPHKEVYSITGVNWQNGIKRGTASYYFSNYPGIWGWATWRDRWQQYDFNLSGLEDFLATGKLGKIALSDREKAYHADSFRRSRQVDTWDYQWKYTVFRHQGYCIIPNVNLITNVGFGEDATHTKGDSWRAGRQSFSMEQVLVHPEKIERNEEADQYLAEHVFLPPLPKVSLIGKMKRKLKQVLGI